MLLMKRIISAATVAGLFAFAACNTTSKQNETALQVQHAIDSMNTELAKKKVIDSMSELTKVQYVFPQNMQPPVAQQPAAAKAPVEKVVYIRQERRLRRHAAQVSHYDDMPNSDYSAPVQQAPVYTSDAPAQSPVPATVPERKTWSAKAKGSIIGAGAGAVAGAILNGRNRAAGAVIGGILGAGAGAGIGTVIDHRNGR